MLSVMMVTKLSDDNTYDSTDDIYDVTNNSGDNNDDNKGNDGAKGIIVITNEVHKL